MGDSEQQNNVFAFNLKITDFSPSKYTVSLDTSSTDYMLKSFIRVEATALDNSKPPKPINTLKQSKFAQETLTTTDWNNLFAFENLTEVKLKENDVEKVKLDFYEDIYVPKGTLTTSDVPIEQIQTLFNPVTQPNVNQYMNFATPNSLSEDTYVVSKYLKSTSIAVADYQIDVNVVTNNNMKLGTIEAMWKKV